MASRNKNKHTKSKSEHDDNEARLIEKGHKISDESSTVQEMTTGCQHYFGSIEDGFSISIIENMKEDYGLFVWPSSIILAEYIWQQKIRFSGANVVELGAGTSLPGLVAAKVGAEVTLTDYSSEVLGLSWGVWDEPIFSLRPNIILGADVFYDSKYSVFITTYHNRSGHHLIEFLMEKWHLKCTKLVDGFGLMPSHKASNLSGNIQLAEIVLDT
ncbi:hypothetical protein CASFOL_005652 [Castilleja foliolosa]|uniref:Methyltransferase-like protein 23 n=1 Tax=Castilleja foliolosa TaxID=1961234 RepID=A0ABD3E821_9LAMI